MAYIWHGVVSFATEGLARSFVEHFDRSMFKLPHAGACELRLGVEKNESGWEVLVCPYVDPEGPDGVSHGGPWHLNGHGGANTPEEVEDIDACAEVFYARLGRVPSQGYRFALTGFEVGDWRSAGQLLDDLSPDGLYDEHRKQGFKTWDGLVVSQWLWWAAERPDGFVRFGADYFWIPFSSIAKSQ